MAESAARGIVERLTAMLPVFCEMCEDAPLPTDMIARMRALMCDCAGVLLGGV